MAKKQISFADKAAKTKGTDAVYVKYVKSVRSEKTGQWHLVIALRRTEHNATPGGQRYFWAGPASLEMNRLASYRRAGLFDSL